jgi:hypothetical protein
MKSYILSLMMLLSAINAYAQVPDYSAVINTQAAYIIARQAPSGAIQMTTEQDKDGFKIEPYFANLACAALIASNGNTYSSIVQKWLTWYFSHLNGDGSIYDYYITANGEITEKDDDSEDSYAATFLSLCNRFAKVSDANKQFIQSHRADIVNVAGKIASLIDPQSGMTYAKQSYQMEYLEDNCEVNQGVKDLLELFQNIIPDDVQYQQWSERLKQNNAGIAGLWDSANMRYLIALGDMNYNGKILYPDGSCELYPMIYVVLLPGSKRAKTLISTFDANFPAWQTGAIIDTGGFHLAIVVSGAAVMGDNARVQTYLTWLQNTPNPTPWNVMEAAESIQAAVIMEHRGAH